MRRIPAREPSCITGTLAFAVACLLAGCSGPSIVAKTRGLFCESHANSAYALHDQLTPQAESDYKNAVEQFDSAIKLSKRDAQSHYHRGWCRRRLGLQKEALNDFTEALALAPHDFQCWKMRAGLFEDMQLYDKAEEDYAQAEQLAPKMADIWSSKARCESILHEYKKSIEDATTAISISGLPFYYAARAGNYRAAGNLDAMNRDYKHALALNPHDWDIYRARAYSEFIVGNYRAAIQDFKTVLQGTDYTHAHAPYAVLLGILAARLEKTPQSAGDENFFVTESRKNFAVPLSQKPPSGETKVAQRWPLPAIQFICGDISQQVLFQTAGNDRDRLTEAHCYAALEDLLNKRKQSALQHFRWISEKGNKGYVEYDVACKQVAQTNSPAPSEPPELTPNQ